MSSTDVAIRDKRSSVMAQRKRRNEFAEMCQAELRGVLDLWLTIMRDPKLSLTERMQAAEKIVCRAVGEVPKAPVEDGESAGTVNNGPTLYQFQWLPPDPADHSK